MDATAKKMVARNQRLLGKNIAQLKRDAAECAAKGGYRMAGVTYNDIADLLDVAAAVRAQDFELARKLVNDLETVPREEVPSELYRWLFQQN